MRNRAGCSFWLAALAALVGCAGSESKFGGPDTGGNGGDSTGSSFDGQPGTGPDGAVLMLDSGPAILPQLCDMADAPADCQVMAAPGCGDGLINEANEQCDDGNSIPGDGCSGTCQIEPYYTCPTPGQPCVSTIVCGDGVVGPDEECDDGNTMSGDGCSSKCLIEKGYSCPTPDKPCVQIHICGDGTVDPNEGCDDGNTVSGDGCSSRCQIEIGYQCKGSPSVCTPTTCGDGKVQGAESCDDGNALPFDGCSETCQKEPTCPLNAPCTSTCGDGILLGANEQCDDGNLRDGDGCSSTCQIEPGFMCTNDNPCVMVNGMCSMTVPAIFRDQDQSLNPDIEPSFDNQVAITGLVKPLLATDLKPALAGPGCVADNSCAAATDGYIHSPTTYGYWYHDTPGINGVNPGSIVLWQSATDMSSYVNRWGPQGQQWPSYTVLGWCANSGDATTCATSACNTPFNAATQVCLGPCTPYGNTTEVCNATVTYLDGNPLFFPIDNAPNLVTPKSSYSIAEIPQPVYNGNWADEPSGALHNFGFTSEIRYWFKYNSAATATLDFVGDDDVWVFVNGHLALDLGGWHIPLEQSFTISAATAATYNLTNGDVYQIAVFQTERKLYGSSFKLTLSGFDTGPSVCTAICGDGVISAGEECDNGTANSDTAYGGCTTQCVFGPRCGDDVVQNPPEACDDGVNDTTYATTPGACGPNCQLAPYCGDSVVQKPQEQCDNGVNDGSYGTCNPNCTLAPHCGDGIVQTADGEQCDDGNQVGGDGCSPACKLETIAPPK